MFAFDELDEQEAKALEHEAEALEAAGAIDFAALDAAELERREEGGGDDEQGRQQKAQVAQRCAFERERSSYCFQRQSPTGLFFRLALPRSPAELLQLGAGWLTRALRRARTLPEDGSVSEILAMRPLARQGASQLMEVAFSTPRESLVFVVHFFQDESNQPRRLRGILRSRTCDASFVSGINFLRLLESELETPAGFIFGDVCEGGTSGLLITEWSRVPSPSISFCSEPSWSPESMQQCFIVPDSRPDLCLVDVRGLASPYVSLPVPGQGSLGLDSLQTWQALKDHRNSWTLMTCDDEAYGRLWRLRSSSGALLVAQNSTTLGLAPPAKPVSERAEMWTLMPGADPGQFFIRSFYDTYLVHNVSSRFVSLTPGRGSKARWTIQTRTDWLANETGQLAGPLEIRGDGLSLHTMKELVCDFARLAGRCGRKGVLLEPLGEMETPAAPAGGFEDNPNNTPNRAQYSKDRVALLERMAAHQFQRLERFDSPRAALGFQDSKFLDKASAAQEFISRLAVGMFPPGTMNKQAMKDYRAALVTARVNGFGIRNFLQLQDIYRAIGMDFLGPHSLYMRNYGGLRRLTLQEWDTMTDGPLGFKIWRWLLLAKPEILTDSLEQLLDVFIATFRDHGGPQLDREELLWHVLLAAALQSVELLEAVPLLLEKIPREGWQQIKSLADPRLHEGGAGDVWLAAKAFVHVAIVTQRYGLVAKLELRAPEIFAANMLIQNGRGAGNKHLTPIFIRAGGVHEARAAASTTSELLALLPPGTPGCAVLTFEEQDMVKTGAGQGWAQLAMPFTGFVDMAALQLCTWQDLPTLEDEIKPEFEVLSLMYHTRRQYTGSNGPMFMDELSAKKLHDEIQTREKVSRMVTRLGMGTCSVVHGSFLASTQRMPWWPSQYQDWAYHSFILFEDGTIADITADLFDTSVPQLWFPADSTRYDRSSHRAEEARFARQVLVGLDNWRQAVQDHRDKSHKEKSTGRQAYDWFDAEMKGGFDVRNGQKGQVLRYGKTLPLPSPARVVSVGSRRVYFRRLTDPKELDVSLVEGLFEPGELQELLAFCEQRQGFTASLQKDKQGHVVQDGRRTSESCAMLWPMLYDVSPDTEAELAAASTASRRCAEALGVEADCVEPLQLVKYTPGQYYRAHMDTHQEPDRLGSFNGEQRTHTLLVFVSSVPESDGGGHLHFPLLELRILPKAGTAVLWDNLKLKGDGESMEPDPCALHEGEPPLGVNKVAMNVWIVDRPFSKQTVEEALRKRARAAAS